MSIALVRFGCKLFITNAYAAGLSVWIGVWGCFWPIYCSVFALALLCGNLWTWILFPIWRLRLRLILWFMQCLARIHCSEITQNSLTWRNATLIWCVLLYLCYTAHSCGQPRSCSLNNKWVRSPPEMLHSPENAWFFSFVFLLVFLFLWIFNQCH